MKLAEEKITFLKISSLIFFSIKRSEKLAILVMTPFAAKDRRTKPCVWQH